MRPVIFGTAGHIDHGKTALVKALTGTDTDRLKEEKERGITIELGYAFLTDRIAIIDVPGHERFIKNMVAGASTVDFALLVVAADDGIMPQTREHFDILRLLGVEDGAIAITKCALAEDEWIDLVQEEIAEMVAGSFLEDKPIARVDSLDKSGIDALREVLLEIAGRKKDKAPGSVFRLPIDRVFTIKGFGTVVTGSALTGSVNVDDRLELLPRGTLLRVRGIETQGQKSKTATAGMRVALNVPQVAVDEVNRGDVLASPERLEPTFMLDVECRMLEASPVPLEQRQRVRVHLGTKEVMARAVILDRDTIEPGDEGLVQLRLEERTSAQRLDRYVIRRYSPQLTIGGGRVLDANPRKHRKRHTEEVVGTLRTLGDAKDEQLILRLLDGAGILSFDDLVTRVNLPAEQVDDIVGALGVDGEVIELEAKGARNLAAKSVFDKFELGLLEALRAFHKKHPLRGGAKRGEILMRWKKELPDFLVKHFVEVALSRLTIKSPGGDLLALHDYEVRLTKKQRAALNKIDASLLEGEFQPPDVTALAAENLLDDKGARQLAQVLVDQGQAINMEGKIYFHEKIVAKGVALLRKGYEKQSEMTMSDFRQLVGTTRKYALPLLNYYDSQGYTTRRGDVRVPGTRLEEKNDD
ncbi:MAG: selenocysteine-specific translation elongation factor [Deltaproteobacteria bacterium]|nr:selenocysteine-specific translation elongation factor [Deltaproteobacteria bacterium]